MEAAMGKVKEATVMLLMFSALVVVTTINAAANAAIFVYYEAVLGGEPEPFTVLCTKVRVVTGGWTCGP
jgi:hypothetical protein